MVLLPEWECGTCTALQKQMRGCEEEATKPIELDGEPQLRCPRRPLLERPVYFDELFWLYSNYTSGILPEAGGLVNQPAKLMAMLRCLKSAKSAAEREKDERENRKRAAQQRAAQMFGAG
jgi:hypothetical protein